MAKSIREKLKSVEGLRAFLREARQSEDVRQARAAIIEGPHPPPDQLFAYAMGELSAEYMDKWSKHFAHCPTCSDRMIMIRSVEGDVSRLVARSTDGMRRWRDILRGLEHSREIRVNLRSRKANIIEEAPNGGGQPSGGYKVLRDQWVMADSFSTGEAIAAEVEAPSGGGNIAAFLDSDLTPLTIVFPTNEADEDTYVPRSKRKTVRFEAPSQEGRFTLKVIWTREDFLYPHEIDFEELETDDTLQTFAESLPLIDKDEWALANCSFTVQNPPGDVGERVELAKNAEVVAVRAVDLLSSESDYWTTLIFDELRKGIARFGWCAGDLRSFPHKGYRSAREQECWSHANFLLGLKEGDVMIYVNVPKRTQCTIVKVKYPYNYGEVWDAELRGDFRHSIGCEYIGVFERDCIAVHPDLSGRLRLRGSHWRLTSVKDHVASLLSYF